MAEFPPAAEGIELIYQHVNQQTGEAYPLTAEEWATVKAEDFAVTSDTNLEYEIVKNDTVGSLSLLVRAPAGNVYAANTGELEVTVTGSHVFDEQKTEASTNAPIEVRDDLSFMDRLAHWFSTVGWKLLLIALLSLLALGYIFKRRFSKKMKRRPSVVGTPRTIGTSIEEGTGKFRMNNARRFLPFVANTATLSYVPAGVSGFRPMKLKAGPRKTMVITNWKQIAERENTEINGTPLTKETRKPPTFGPSATITASTPQMTYEMNPNA